MAALEPGSPRLPGEMNPAGYRMLNQWQAIRKEVNSSESEMNMKRAGLDAFSAPS